MFTSASAVRAPAFSVPVRRFQHYEEALQAVVNCVARLCSNASQRQLNGLTVTDQDEAEEVFCLAPARPNHPPLAIVGGMGPLAGALAFNNACTRFRNSCPVVLYQACSVPDRSTVILAGNRPDRAACQKMAARLADAVRLAVDFASPAHQPSSCIIACNSAHYFWQLMMDDLRQTRCGVRMMSLVETSVEALKLLSCERVLLLATEGARVGQVFSAPCRDNGIAFDEPSPALSRLLMSTVFEGMKALNEQRAVELGNQFFEGVLKSGRSYDCILAGCTELPVTIDLLRVHGSSAVSSFLSRVNIVDPVEEALCRV